MQPVDIRPDHLRLVLDILRQHVPMAEVWAFGSRAKWLARDTSDLDLCIRDAAPLSFEQMGLLREAFEESNLPYKVDVVDWATISASFRKVVERDKVVTQEAKRGGGMAGDLAQHEVEKLIKEGTLLINDGYRAKNSELSHNGIPFARAGNIDGGFYFDDADCVPPETLARVGLKRSRPGDVVFTSKGTVGRFAFVRDGTPEFVYSPQLCYWRSCDTSRIHPRWLFYWMNGREFFLQFKGVSGQTDMAEYVSLRDQRSMKITLPPLPEQKAIAHILGTLDDKIELNRRMNATLEAMARALFQSWFVDFDPVRAKLDGRKPAGLDAATAALFPATFQDSTLGHIPKGWEVKTLGEVLELAYGKPLKAEDRKNGSICVYGANGPVGWHDEKLVSGPGIVVGRKGNPGVVTWAHGNFYPIDTTFYVVPTGGCRSLYFFYYALSVHNLANLSADSAVPGLNRNHAYMSKQVIPRQPVLEAFDSQITPIFATIHANEQQSRTLATIRDALLPKLLSGELSVTGLESKLAEIVTESATVQTWKPMP